MEPIVQPAWGQEHSSTDCAWAAPTPSFGKPGPTLLNNSGPVDKAIFNALDANKDGYISRSEWEQMARKPFRVDVPTQAAWGASSAPSPRPYQSDGLRPPASPREHQCDEILVEVKPDLQPQLTPGPNGTFTLEVQIFNVGLHTTCAPATSSMGPTPVYKPYEIMPVYMPELTRVVFDPSNNMPRNGQLSCSVSKHGDVMEFESWRSINAKIKTESPYGKMTVGDYVLNWRLHVEGKIEPKRGVGNSGADRLEVDLQFQFDCYMSKEFDGARMSSCSSAPSPRFEPQAAAWGSAMPTPASGPSPSAAQQGAAWGSAMPAPAFGQSSSVAQLGPAWGSATPASAFGQSSSAAQQATTWRPSSGPSPSVAQQSVAWGSAMPAPAFGPSSSVEHQLTTTVSGTPPPAPYAPQVAPASSPWVGQQTWMPTQAFVQEPIACGGTLPFPSGPGMAMQSGRELECFVEVMPTIHPLFEKGAGNSYVMTVPGIDLQFTTGCTPQPPLIDNRPAFKPREDVPLAFPEISQVVFDPDTNVPRDGCFHRTKTTKGCVMEFPPAFSIDAKLKTNSKNGSVHITNGATGRETVLHWKLHIEGKLLVNKEAGTFGTNRLEGELFVTFECRVSL